ncbi:hypothetical protein F4680DRAFT_427607 [Xylaria scruposa]|nr:hypothetical protein F4680DRAFT_427607 [Xylaria scruposa]
MISTHHLSISGLVVKSIVAIDGPRVRFTADAYFIIFLLDRILIQCVQADNTYVLNTQLLPLPPTIPLWVAVSKIFLLILWAGE